INGCPVPVIIAGGPKCETEKEVFEFVYDGMSKGAVGLNLGRNVWQCTNPVPMAMALNAIVHEKADVATAMNIFEKAKNKTAR
ncbi:MAG: 3-hydroxy-5-phosphonooxypentane-2,4-dione thiolase LsrF, partial [Elusimicrobiota bacterium]